MPKRSAIRVRSERHMRHRERREGVNPQISWEGLEQDRPSHEASNSRAGRDGTDPESQADSTKVTGSLGAQWELETNGSLLFF